MVFRTGCIGLKLISTGRLRQYQMHIKYLASQYPTSWALVYQADVRMRSERMPLIKARLEDQDELAKKNGWVRTYNHDMPWTPCSPPR